STPIHNHGTWGVIGLIQGREYEVHYDPLPEGAPTKIEERFLNKGEVMICCTTDKDVHEVSCASNIPTVGIHVYGDNIGKIERQVYDKDTGHVKRVITSWDSIPDL